MKLNIRKKYPLKGLNKNLWKQKSKKLKSKQEL